MLAVRSIRQSFQPPCSLPSSDDAAVDANVTNESSERDRLNRIQTKRARDNCVYPAEAERVREIFAISAGSGNLAAAQQEIQARGLLTKDWTSKSGKHHGGGGFTRSRLEALLRNVLYIGQICFQGVVYPGEQPAIVERALWQRVQ